MNRKHPVLYIIIASTILMLTACAPVYSPQEAPREATATSGGKLTALPTNTSVTNDITSVTSALSQLPGEAVAVGKSTESGKQDGSQSETVTSNDDVDTLLPEALVSRDYVALEEMMGNPFTIGYWRSEGQVLTPNEALEQLRLNLLSEPTKLTFTSDPNSFPNLSDFDPSNSFGPDVQIADLIYSQGWGADGLNDAILTIGLKDDGVQYWHGIIYSIGGFSKITDQQVREPALSYEVETYQNVSNGFEFDYPANWDIDEEIYGERGSGAQFYSKGEFMLLAVVYLWDPKNDLDAYIDQRRLGWSSSGTVLSEEELKLTGGRRAVQFEKDDVDGKTNYVMLTEVGDRYLEIAVPGDQEQLEEIAKSLRPLSRSQQ